MGYVLPVRPYQYSDYQSRLRIDSKDPMHIERSFPVILASEHHDIAKEYTDPKREFIHIEVEGKSHLLPAEKVYANLTGKGRNFNDTV